MVKDPYEKIDWHDYAAIEKDNARTGKYYSSYIILCDILWSLKLYLS